MNGFAEHGLDEGAFGEKGSNIVQAFDAFRKLFWLSSRSSQCSSINWGIYVNYFFEGLD